MIIFVYKNIAAEGTVWNDIAPKCLQKSKVQLKTSLFYLQPSLKAQKQEVSNVMKFAFNCSPEKLFLKIADHLNFFYTLSKNIYRKDISKNGNIFSCEPMQFFLPHFLTAKIMEAGSFCFPRTLFLQTFR